MKFEVCAVEFVLSKHRGSIQSRDETPPNIWCKGGRFT